MTDFGHRSLQHLDIYLRNLCTTISLGLEQFTGTPYDAQMPIPVPISIILFGFCSGARNSLSL